MQIARGGRQRHRRRLAVALTIIAIPVLALTGLYVQNRVSLALETARDFKALHALENELTISDIVAVKSRSEAGHAVSFAGPPPFIEYRVTQLPTTPDWQTRLGDRARQAGLKKASAYMRVGTMQGVEVNLTIHPPHSTRKPYSIDLSSM